MSRLLHRVEELRILGRFHRDLREEHHVVRQLRQPRHQLEPLRAQRLQLVQPRRDRRAARAMREIVERDRIEVVVGERDEAEAAAPQLDDLLDHAIDAALARLLAVGAPHRAERAVLRAAAHRLHRRPHVRGRAAADPSAPTANCSPADPPAVVDRLRTARQAVRDDAAARRDRRRL